MTVRGVYGMSEKTGAIYYNVETDNGRRVTLVNHVLRKVEPDDIPAPPAPAPPKKPGAEKTPEVKEPAPPEAKKPEVWRLDPPVRKPAASARPAADFSNKSPLEIRQLLEARHAGFQVSVGTTRTGESVVSGAQFAKVVVAMDDLFEAYPDIKTQIKAVRIIAPAEMAKMFPRRRGGSKYWGYATKWPAQVYLNSQMIKDGDRSPLHIMAVDAGFHPPGCDTVRSVVAHEFGHQLDYTLETHRQGDDMHVKWATFRNQNALTLKHASNYADQIYRKSGTREGIAESFAQLDAKLSGYYKGAVTASTAALEKFLADNKVGGGRGR